MCTMVWVESGMTSCLPVFICSLVSHMLMVSVMSLVLSSNHLGTMVFVIVWMLMLVMCDCLEGMWIVPVIVVCCVLIMMGMVGDWVM